MKTSSARARAGRERRSACAALLGTLCVLCANAIVDAAMSEAGHVVDFREPAAAARWVTVNDDVMGGVSSARVTRTEQGTGVFAGTVSLANNGGFASARTTIAPGTTADGRALVARVRGDGRRYQLRVRPDDAFDGVSYRFEFDAPAGEWTTVRAPFDAFVATFRGREVPGAPALAPQRVRQVGFLIAGKQAGPFALEIDWIGVAR